MICKEKEKQLTNDKLRKAGQDQEFDVAFYLRREFKNDEKVFVFNDLKFNFDGESAQIDHLIVHHCGFIIIESKSITGNVVVNQHGEWSRSYNGRWYGMSSPIVQASLQSKVLCQLLNHHKSDLLRKMFGIIQAGFGGRTWESLVAISSNAIINRKYLSKSDSNLIVKSEFIPESVRGMISHNLKTSTILDPKPKFSNQELENICDFILNSQEQGLKSKETTFEASQDNVQIRNTPIVMSCNKCGNINNLAPKKGQYGHYVSCGNCTGNTALKRPCPSCRSKETSVTLLKGKYTLNCAKCENTSPFIIQD